MITAADVYKSGVRAARLVRHPTGVEFSYLDDYLRAGRPAIASTLPLSDTPRVTAAGAVPPFFAGLLPEGRRLTALRQAAKASADDELTLLVAVGGDTVGDVVVTPPGEQPAELTSSIELDEPLESIRFASLLVGAGLPERKPALAGVQDKMSATMISLPVGHRHERYILKLTPPENPRLVENEAFFLEQSQKAGIATVQARLIHDRDGEPGLLITRFDRTAGNGSPEALAVEDACQALDLWPADKYNTTMEDVAAVLLRLSTAPAITARAILQQLVFAWLTGNGDCHAKNLSMVTDLRDERVLAPAYDLPSSLYYGDTTMALTVDGRDTLSPARLRDFAAGMGLAPRAVSLTMRRLLERTSGLLEAIESDGPRFDRRTRTKIIRQLSIRRRDLGSEW